MPLERWDLLNSAGDKTGQTIWRGNPLRQGQYHLVVHVWIVNASGALLIQKRAPFLCLMPGIWAVTGGSAVSGEIGEVAALRELAEELGIFPAEGALRCLGQLRRRNSHCEVWRMQFDSTATELSLQADEVAQVRWVCWDTLMAMVAVGTFHNYGKGYFDWLKTRLYGDGACE